MTKDTILKSIQKEELKLLKECIEICEENNITYFALGGTLLGAVRHQGFIPWDDDIDLGIPRAQYSKFLEGIKRKNNAIIEESIINLNVPQYARKDKIKIGEDSYRVYIDIFPLDGTPNGNISRKIFLKKFIFYRTLYKLSIASVLNKVDRGVIGNVIVGSIKMFKLDKIMPTEKIVQKIHNIARQYNFSDSKYVGNILGRYREKEIVKKEIFGEGIKLKFEDIEVNCPKDYDGYLKNIYGDYMKLPEEKDRVAHFELE